MNGPTIWLRGQLLGKGSFSRVYQIEDLHTGKFYAGKFPGSKIMPREGEITEDAEILLKELANAKKILQNEINIHSKIDHPNIIRYITNFRTKSCYEEREIVVHELISFTPGICKTLILELCPNQSVGDMMKLRGKITEVEASYIIFSIGKALKYLKDQNIVHRDVKPDNIMLCDEMIPKLSDFGLSARVEAGGTLKRLVGTASYASPEMLDYNYSYSADMWALGVTFFYLVTGRLPFTGKTLEDLFNNIQYIIYYIPPEEEKLFSETGIDLIRKIFVRDLKRITIEDFLKQAIFTSASMLERLPYESKAIKPSSKLLKSLLI